MNTDKQQATMRRTQIKLGTIEHNRRMYVAACFQWMDGEEVMVKDLSDGKTIEVYAMDGRRLCRTNEVCYPADRQFETVGGERLLKTEG